MHAQATCAFAAIYLCGCSAMLSSEEARAVISPQGCYAMSGTDLAYVAIGLCACYATSWTDLVCAATRLYAQASSNRLACPPLFANARATRSH
eukprot:3004343-Rhodomonas_salina.1